jgi:hypothetical protein
MFEVGREYMFTTGTGEQEASWWGEVLEVSLPLIRVTGADREIIINTSSPGFVSAEIQPHRSPEEKETSRKTWDGLVSRPRHTD